MMSARIDSSDDWMHTAKKERARPVILEQKSVFFYRTDFQHHNFIIAYY